RWSALFPAIAASWNVGREGFMSSQKLFDNLKLRLSWGQSGNQELSFGNYDYIPLISLNNSVYPFGQPGVNATGATASIASLERSWETISTYNAGLDFGLLNSRLSGSFEVYMKRNSDMLVAQELPALLGGAAPTQNIGELETKGFDLSLSWKDRINDFSYGITFLLSDSKNKLLSLKGSDAKGEGLYKVREGYSMYSFFGYKSDGIIRTQEQLDEYKKLGGTVPARIGIGDMMYHDMDGDGKITTFGDDGQSGDLVCIGNLLPRYMYSSNIELSYKNVDFSIFLQGVGKRNVVRTGDFQAPFQQWWYQPLAYYYGKTWTTDRPDATVPRIIEGGRGWDDVRNWNYRYSDSPHRLIDVSYLRVKLITLAYRIPQSICDKMKIQGIRIYASGQDLFTFANGTWGGSFDPEEGWQRNDLYTYPFSNIVSFGLDVKF
ncbi:MAG: TonB-dependent receptor, partial [Dysgonamonadaceae bacterium]|nr:TonB-dependent receptor [Dysgonamonadaceae bacterium]